ncbi:MAG: DUF554 family protein [Actinobacteria bacterium]|nr:DUF554 family protein [Actinomycetota bacterium]MSW16424.1 DUF554 family protein [Actinomycetota bacterium]MSX85567.1 DUF554 family protein [Actinomycetota bacterium]MSZ00303.1 DUF554 family protein [Actinomycetota bacterium]MSZ62292.1 DUF554 family protein [Actinomycetota bacterium]
MFPGFGTIINIVAIILGSLIGILLGKKFKEDTKNLITDVLGFITLISGAAAIYSIWNVDFVKAVPTGWTLLTVLGALLLGAIVGSVLNIEARLEKAGEKLKSKFDPNGASPFVDGFVSASLIFAIGPLAILGSISDGMGTGIDQLILKSMLDFFAAIAFAASLGWGVAVSAVAVGVYQGIWTLLGFGLGSILSDYQIAAMTAVGGVMLLGIAMRLLKIRDIAVGNLLPALAIAPALALLVHQFV